ncbi:MAG: valine--tRNA ligase [Candidatus Omnitrophota bacterium]|jgi:valyl-tRNA synthetase|nr:MAG: valine--tRNA ligase [Candidatus Omnitrophota bacterium]
MELPKRYDPSSSREKWYQFWLNHDSFRAAPNPDKAPFAIVIPPPNVTGKLHIGHALNNTLQDILCRWKRMEGFEVLWMPGTDHAGIATQNVVEKQLAKEGLSRHDLGREKLIERIWEWKKEYGDAIIHQLKYLGSSCDWSRTRFTMDDGCSRAVREVFVRLYEDGYLYRGTYLVNWCPRCHTTLSDDEVEYVDETGKFYHIHYRLADGSGHLTIATTRPETLLGDTAVAVHPDDERYRELVGKEVILPLLERRIPIIADSYVDREFGTGALKITPAHDINDFEVGKRHNLPQVNIFNPDATINENGGAYQGLDRFVARKRVVEDLQKQGLLENIDDLEHRVGSCYRCNTFVEPYLSLQWFIKMKPLMEEPLKVVRAERTRFIPKQWENTFFSWVENVRDWPISRQIWWGHRIPVWYCDACGKETVARTDPARCLHCGSTGIRQDEDVLDTWFSSALWPFSTMGWPDKTPLLDYFYPTTVLVTAHDIIYFWVARMIMMGLYIMKDVPFSDVYITALVRDAQGRKMSKSLGNAIDPIDVINQYGVDSVRFTLAILAAQGRNINLAEERIEGYRNFTNKIWNASRLIMATIEDGEILANEIPTAQLEWPDRWILSRFQHTIAAARKGMEEYKFNESSEALYQFIWHEYCDWYLELIKPRLYGEDENAKRVVKTVALKVLESSLRMLHPFVPFITEEIWQILKTLEIPEEHVVSISCTRYPQPELYRIDDSLESEVARFQQIIYTIRNIRGELGISPAAVTTVEFMTQNASGDKFLHAFYPAMKTLCKINDELIAGSHLKPHPASSVGIVDGCEIRVHWPAEVEKQEIERLKKQIDQLSGSIERREKKLSNANFTERAPAEVVEKERGQFEKEKSEHERLAAQLVLLTENSG